jgi:hypothetical protein
MKIQGRLAGEMFILLWSFLDHVESVLVISAHDCVVGWGSMLQAERSLV